MKSRLSYQMWKNRLKGLVIIGFTLVLVKIVFSLYKEKNETNSSSDFGSQEKEKTRITLEKFNPNDLNKEEWQKLGFSAKESETIINYKNKFCGGFFTSPEQFSKCYAVSHNKFSELKPYLIFPKVSVSQSRKIPDKKKHRKQLNIFKKFDPNLLSEADWKNMGFSARQASSIIRYRKYLGGRFKNREDIRKCYVIDEEHYNEMKNFLLFPIYSEVKGNIPSKKNDEEFYFNPNDLDLNGWMKIGFSEKQAQAIINYKNKKLKGRFKTAEDLEKNFVVSSQKFRELKNRIKLPLEEEKSISEVEKADIEEVKIDNSIKKDLNSINFDELINFKFSQKQAAGFLSYRKKLGGFVDSQQVYEAYFIDDVLAQRLVDSCVLNDNRVQKFDVLNVDDQILKEHPYFKKYADRIIYLRISYSSEKEILKKLNPKKEDLKKMELYLTK